MPTRPCPVCAATALRHLPGVSAMATANYYRCPECAHVFTSPKNERSERDAAAAKDQGRRAGTRG